jgi:hypothetical protein
MSQHDANEVDSVNQVNDLRDWFWARGVSFLIRALSLHGLSGAFLLLGAEEAGTNVDSDEHGDASDGADEPARDSMLGFELASAMPLGGSDDDGYEPPPMVIPLKRPLVALNQVAW